MAERRNLVVILSDQHRRDTIACYGNDWIHTPRLNALGRPELRIRGVVRQTPICRRAAVNPGNLQRHELLAGRLSSVPDDQAPERPADDQREQHQNDIQNQRACPSPQARQLYV